MKIKHKAELRGTQLAARKLYALPVLREFGPVGALTQSGTMGVVEASALGMCSQDDMRVMC